MVKSCVAIQEFCMWTNSCLHHFRLNCWHHSLTFSFLCISFSSHSGSWLHPHENSRGSKLTSSTLRTPSQIMSEISYSTRWCIVLRKLLERLKPHGQISPRRYLPFDFILHCFPIWNKSGHHWLTYGYASAWGFEERHDLVWKAQAPNQCDTSVTRTFLK